MEKFEIKNRYGIKKLKEPLTSVRQCNTIEI